MTTGRQGWTHLQREKGPDFLNWIEQNRLLQKKFNILANALNTLLHRNIRTITDPVAVWKAIPAVIDCLNKQSTHEQRGAATAYAWLYLPERYVRTWFALKRLLKKNCLPMGKEGVRVLDIGTGPGPSAFAILDFYNSMVEFADLKRDDKWRQPPDIRCFELADGTNQFRHHLAELIYQDPEGRYENVLAMCNALPDFGKLHPAQERAQRFRNLRNEEDEYYDEISNEWTSELRYSLDEANDIAQSAHRYRLLVFSNFLTTKKILEPIETNIVETLRDAHPGTVLLVIGGNYPGIYSYIEELAKSAGFQLKIKDDYVTSKNSELSDRIYREELHFYKYLKNLVPAKYHNEPPLKIRNHFETSRSPATNSRVWAYRKMRY